MARDLNTAGEMAKRRVSTTGPRGGRPWTKRAVYKLLVNPVYLGEPILAGRTVQAIMLDKLERPLPASWNEQRGWFGAPF